MSCRNFACITSFMIYNIIYKTHNIIMTYNIIYKTQKIFTQHILLNSYLCQLNKLYYYKIITYHLNQMGSIIYFNFIYLLTLLSYNDNIPLESRVSSVRTLFLRILDSRMYPGAIYAC